MPARSSSPRSPQKLFLLLFFFFFFLASSASAPALVVVFVSFFELRKDRCYDLLNDRKEVVLRDDGTGDTAVVGLKEVLCASAAEALAALEAGNALRATEATVNNAQSSRSHAVCQFSIGSPASASTAVAVGGGGGDGGGAEAASAEEEKGEKTEEKAPDGAAAEASAADADASGSSSPSSSSSSSESSGGSGGRLRVWTWRVRAARGHAGPLAERLQETKDINYSLGCLKRVHPRAALGVQAQGQEQEPAPRALPQLQAHAAAQGEPPGGHGHAHRCYCRGGGGPDAVRGPCEPHAVALDAHEEHPRLHGGDDRDEHGCATAQTIRRPGAMEQAADGGLGGGARWRQVRGDCAVLPDHGQDVRGGVD